MKNTIIYKLLLLCACFGYVLTGYAQEQLSKQILIEDFNTYITFVEQTHPDPYSAYGGRVEFKRAAQNARNSITESTSKEQFCELLSTFIAQLGDGHTYVHSNSEQNSGNEPNKFWPFKLKVATNGIFIALADNKYTQHIGSKLIAINNIPIDSLLKKAKRIYPSENEYGAYNNLCILLSNTKETKLLFDKILPSQMLVQPIKGKQQTVQINYIEKPEWTFVDSKVQLNNKNNLLYSQMLGNKQDIGYFIWNSMSSREMVEDVAKNNPQNLEMKLNSLYKYSMQIPRSGNDSVDIEKIPSLYHTFSELLKAMKTQKSNYLIIDLRKNGGGMTPLCLPLLYMMYGDKYLNYECKAEYDRLLSPLLLKKWEINSIDEFNSTNNTNYKLGDFILGRFLGNNKGTIEERRKDMSSISYLGKGIGREYTENLNGNPIYKPHVIVLTSPKTFSAAYHFVYFLTQIGNATVVGVPSSQAGNTFMETTDFELPNTKITGSISNSIQIFFPNNPVKGKVLMPDFAMQWSDYAKYNFDENAEILYALDLIKQWKIK